jgi:GIY-YIG catalytic domain
LYFNLSPLTFFNLSLAYDNNSQYYITKFESNNNDSSISNDENKKREIVPIASYNNSDILKMNILTENKNKTGIYMWTNNLTNKSYIGSAIDFSNRFKNSYNISYLERETKTNNSMIYKALLKYGYSNFKLDIIEICKSSDLIEREQYYLDLLKPEYNILKTAGSLLGFKYNKDTI